MGAGRWFVGATLGWLVWQGITPPTATAAEPLPVVREPAISAEARSHWSFQPPKRPAIPTVRDTHWVRTPIDAFLLAKLEAAGLAPAPEADKRTLLRRVCYDLTGLPPTLEEQERFLNDPSPDAYEHLVDRLLASPHFGERQAMHWLDVVRYAESNGYEIDGERPSAWRYRDYVVRSFHEDKPYDRFLTEQIAGDLLAFGFTARECADLWIATGMHRCGPIHLVSGNTDPEENRQEQLTEVLTGLGAAALGLTVHCARCHDHKFDPLSQADYYRLQAFFAACHPREVDLSTPEEKADYQKQLAAIMQQIAPLKAQVDAIDTPYRQRIQQAKRTALEPKYREVLDIPEAKRTPEQKKLAQEAQTLIKVTWDEIVAALSPEDRAKRTALRSRQHALEAQLPTLPPQAWAMADRGDPPPTHILRRGEVKRKGAIVPPGVPRVLLPEGTSLPEPILRTRWQQAAVLAPAAVTVSPAIPKAVAQPSRIDLAAWLTRPDHPLTARVQVNRIWQQHFGVGLVASTMDFGSHGERPTHPELLDFLATELVRHGWRMKPIHRMIVLSSAYRQSSRLPAGHPTLVHDPANRLLGRQNRQRLHGEIIRDAMLSVSGTLNPQVGGPMVKIPLEPEVYDLIFTEGEPDGLWPVTPDERQHYRRTLYLFAKRNVRLPILEAFDQPDRLSPCGTRPASIHAPQALILINGPMARDAAKAMAARLFREVPDSVEQRIDRLYRLALGRPARPEEIRLAQAFLAQQREPIFERLLARLPVGVPADLPATADLADAVALADLVLAVFNTNEFVYIR